MKLFGFDADSDGEDRPDGALQVNDQFAKGFDAEATRRTKQKWRDIASRAPLSAFHVNSLRNGARDAIKHLASSHQPSCDPEHVIRWLMADRGWVAASDVTLSKGEGGSERCPCGCNMYEQLANHASMKKPIRTCFVHIKKLAYTGKLGDLPKAPSDAAANGGDNTRKKRRRSEGDDGDMEALVTKLRGRSGDQPTVQRSNEGASDDSSGDETEQARTSSDSNEDTAAIDNGNAHAQARGAVSAGSSLAREASTVPSKDRKAHGRGAGKGRGLDFRGEPKFDEMHPSWQAKRKAQRRQVKAVTKALRGGADADAGVAVVVVPAPTGDAGLASVDT